MTTNGQQYSASALPFLYFGVPHVSSLSVAKGPVLGGTPITVHGSHLGAKLAAPVKRPYARPAIRAE